MKLRLETWRKKKLENSILFCHLVLKLVRTIKAFFLYFFQVLKKKVERKSFKFLIDMVFSGKIKLGQFAVRIFESLFSLLIQWKLNFIFFFSFIISILTLFFAFHHFCFDNCIKFSIVQLSWKPVLFAFIGKFIFHDLILSMLMKKKELNCYNKSYRKKLLPYEKKSLSDDKLNGMWKTLVMKWIISRARKRPVKTGKVMLKNWFVFSWFKCTNIHFESLCI